MLYAKAKRFSIKHEDAYLKFSKDSPVQPTEVGRRQFFDFESCGIVPDEPDPYYLRLSLGRKWLDWQRNDMKEQYLRFLQGETDCGWWGWYQLREDWKGELHILKLLINWKKDLPESYFEEDDGTG